MLAARSQSYSGMAALRQQQQQQPAGARPPGSPLAAPAPAPAAVSTPDRLLTDRSSYISYLESQLERVSAACLTVASYDERLEAVTSAVRLLEERVLNVARLVNCTQQFAEQQEAAQREGLADVGRRLAALEARVEQQAGPHKALAQRLEAVGSDVDAKLEAVSAGCEERLKVAAVGLQAGLDATCHDAHLRLDEQAADVAGRLAELERRLRSLDEYAHQSNVQPQVASLASRLGSVEDSLGHLAQASAGAQQTLATVEGAVGQLRTALVALELRPPGEGGQDTLQWLARAREALKGEIQAVLAQSQQVATGIQSAQQAAQEQPPSPQKAVAAQVLGSMQGVLQSKVGRELQALQLADSFLGNVASQLAHSPRPSAGQQPSAALAALPAPGAAVAADKLPAERAQQQGQAAGAVLHQQLQGPACEAASWSIPAAPGGGQQMTSLAVAPANQAAAGWTLPMATATAGCASPGHTLLRVTAPAAQQPLPSSHPCSPLWVPAPTQQQSFASGAGPVVQQGVGAEQGDPGGGGGGLRGSLGQMQQQLQLVCALLQDGAAAGLPPVSASLDDPLAAIPSSRFLSRTSTLKQQYSSSGGAGSQPKKAWLPGGSVKPPLFPSKSGAAGVARATSMRGLDSAQAQKAVEGRRRRLQQLYSELRG